MSRSRDKVVREHQLTLRFQPNLVDVRGVAGLFPAYRRNPFGRACMRIGNNIAAYAMVINVVLLKGRDPSLCQ